MLTGFVRRISPGITGVGTGALAALGTFLATTGQAREHAA